MKLLTGVHSTVQALDANDSTAVKKHIDPKKLEAIIDLKSHWK